MSLPGPGALAWLSAALLAAGVLQLLAAGLPAVASAVARLRARRRRRRLALRPPAPEVLGDDERAGLAGVRWGLLSLLGLLLGVGTLLAVFGETQPQLAALGCGGLALPRLLRRLLVRRARDRHLQAIWGFLSQLDALIQVGHTLTQALALVASYEGGGLFHQRLVHHVETRLHYGPVAVLRALAADFQAPELELLVLRLEPDRLGGVALSPETLTAATDEVEQEMLVRAELAVESAPAALTLPMLLALFVPLLALTILPLAQSFVDALGAVPAR